MGSDSYSPLAKFRVHLWVKDTSQPKVIEVVFFKDDPREDGNVWVVKTIAAFVHTQYPSYSLVGVM